jgi:ankyrin repeat protein
LQEREAQNKTTQVEVRGMRVTNDKIRKQRGLYEAPLFDRIAARKFNAYDGFTCETMHANIPAERGVFQPQQPPLDVVVYTPAASPSPVVKTNSLFKKSSGCDVTAQYALCLPWMAFQDLAFSLLPTIWEVPTAAHALWTSNTASKLRLYGLLNSTTRDTRFSPLDHSLRSNASNDDVHAVLLNPMPYLPDMCSQNPEATIYGLMGLTKDISGTHLMQLIMYTLSNNFEVFRMTGLVLELIDDPKYLFMLKDALGRQLDTMRAVAEKLLHPAIQHGRLDLLKALFESGLDVDLRVSAADNPFPTTALAHAVERNNLEMVKYLLGKGATDWSASFWSHPSRQDVRYQGSVIDLAVHKGHAELIDKFLRYMVSRPGRFPNVTLCTLRNAILLGRTNIVRLLYIYQPLLLDAAKHVPWVFYEAAVLCEDIAVSTHLVRLLRFYGLDMTAVGPAGRGSSLVAAALAPNEAMVRRLMAAKIPMDSISTGTEGCCVSTTCCCRAYEEKTHSIQGISALLVAIDRNHHDLVKVLLIHGANTKHGCGVYPIQLAAAKGDPNTIATLIRAGADFNATYRTSGHRLDYLNLPPLFIALEKRHVRAAEILYSAGASLFGYSPEDWKQPSVLALLPVIVQRGSQDFVLGITQQWFRDRQLARTYGPILVQRFGMEIVDSLTSNAMNASAQELLALLHNESQLQEIFTDMLSRDSMVRHKLIITLRDRPIVLSSQQLTRLLLAATQARLVDMVKGLLRAGADPFLLVSHCEEEYMRRLDATMDLATGESPFQRSAILGAWEITESFLDWTRGTHDLATQKQMCEAYSLALCKGHVALEQSLLAQGISWSQVGKSLGPSHLIGALQAALIQSIRSKDYVEMLRILAYHPNCTNFINPANRLGRKTPLQYVVSQDHIEYARLFLDLGADVNAAPGAEHGATALQFAAMNGNFQIIDMLIEAGADINAAPAPVGGRTAIEGAAEWGRLDMVYYLLSAGADIQNKRNYRRTIYRARTQGHCTIARMVHKWVLEKYGDAGVESPQSIMETVTESDLDAEPRENAREFGVP